jgi:GDP-4-dehydro-6-deoxy-D-mannose reductase
MRAVVTGATGFIGTHLVDRLVGRNDTVHAWVRAETAAGAALPDAVLRQEVDFLRPASLAAALERARPDAIFHLAAQSLPTLSWQKPWETFEANVHGTLNLLDAARDAGFAGPLIVFGSSSEYADQTDPEKPIREDHPIGANSPYAASKIAASQLAMSYHRRYGLAAMVVRPFFWIGTRKVGDFCSDVARRVVRIERGELDRLTTGNRGLKRDFLDVRDGVDGVLAVCAKGAPGLAYNICSGDGVALGEVIEAYRRLSTTSFPVETDPALLRPNDEVVRTGDPGKVVSLGWKPQRSLNDALAEIMQYWRDRS